MFVNGSQWLVLIIDNDRYWVTMLGMHTNTNICAQTMTSYDPGRQRRSMIANTSSVNKPSWLKLSNSLHQLHALICGEDQKNKQVVE